jgi:hypothetical protein
VVPVLTVERRKLTILDVWLNLWAKSNDEGGKSNLGYWLGIFGLLSFMNGLFMVLAVA